VQKQLIQRKSQHHLMTTIHLWKEAVSDYEDARYEAALRKLLVCSVRTYCTRSKLFVDIKLCRRMSPPWWILMPSYFSILASSISNLANIMTRYCMVVT